MRKFVGLLVAVVVLGLAATEAVACGCNPVIYGSPCVLHPPVVRVRGHFERVVEMVDVCRIVRRPVFETVTRDVTYTVCKPVYENVSQEVAYTQWVPENFTKTITVDRGSWQVQTFTVPGPVVCQRVWVPCLDPCAPCHPCRPRGYFQIVPVQCPPRVCSRSIWVPNLVTEEITCTRLVPVVEKKMCTYQVCRMVPETVTQAVTQNVCRWVCETVVEKVARPRCVWVPPVFVPCAPMAPAMMSVPAAPMMPAEQNYPPHRMQPVVAPPRP